MYLLVGEGGGRRELVEDLLGLRDGSDGLVALAKSQHVALEVRHDVANGVAGEVRQRSPSMREGKREART